MTSDKIQIGMMVEGGTTDEDRDTGRVIEIIDSETALVAWQSGVRTPAPIADLEAMEAKLTTEMKLRGLKIRNEYVQQFGRIYAETPKAVFAAVALSFAYINVEEQGFDLAVKAVMDEWRCLHENGIVPQRPPK